MKDFLALVAEDLIRRQGHDLSHTVIIFPNKRANLFFNEYLTPQDGTPIWAPRYMSISEFFNTLSNRNLVDPIEAVCRLYRHYLHYVEEPKPTLDTFYGWGERLLADFDDIDKCLVDARLLFRDIADYADLEAYDFLEEEQIEQLKRFASDFRNQDLTTLRKNFNRIWKIAYQVYTDFRQELWNENLAYEGLMFREVVENLEKGTIEWPSNIDKFVFVGFNVIDKAEHSLFEHLQKEGKALFYWDYDTWYAREGKPLSHEAGTFIQANLKDFPNALPETDGNFNNFMQNREGKTLEFASSPTETAQAQSVHEWLKDSQNFDPQHAKRTAVVICDETLLQSTIHALPDSISNVNITKGFPLGHTQAFNCVLDKMDDIIRSQFTSPSSLSIYEAVKQIQDQIVDETRKMENLYADNPWLNELNTEAYFQTFTLLTRFLHLIEDKCLDVNLSTLFSLIRQVLRSMSIPFHGEPAEGLQIMGVLETRCLDFDHIIMLSTGDGILPSKSSENSFIPYLIRKQHGLTTPERKNAVFAYYFYRLIQRATHVRLVYNNSTAGSSKGEMSRFMKALLIEHADTLHIRHIRLTSTPRTIKTNYQTDGLKRPDKALQTKYKFSPSALKSYLKCQMQFYYHYILKLDKPQTQDGIINLNDFGTVFHSAAEHLFLDVLDGRSQPITPERINRFLKNGGKIKLEELTQKAFIENGITSSEITHVAVLNYLIKLLHYEAGKDNSAPARSWSNIVCENESDLTLDVPYLGKTVPVTLYGFIDRRDEAELPDGTWCLRIIDYKTGKKKGQSNLTLNDFFEGKKDFPENPLQIFIYALMWTEKTRLPVVPMLYYVPSMSGRLFTPYIQMDNTPVLDFHTIAADFKERLIGILAEIIDPEHVFTQTAVTDHCKYCNYKDLCER